MQADAVFKAVPKGNYVVIKGNKADANADFLRSGMDEIIKAAVDSGDIKIVGETYTDNWDPAKAQTEMEQFLTANANKVDAVLVRERRHGRWRDRGPQGPGSRRQGPGLRSGRRRRRPQQRGARQPDGRRLEGRPPPRQDRRRGRASSCAQGTTVDKITGAAPFTTPGGNSLSSILLTPQPITKDNLNVVLDAGWIAKDKLCAGVDAATGPAACK